MCLELLKSRRVAGESQLTLRRPEGGTVVVARDWTDRSCPTISDLLRRSIVLDCDRLLLLATLIKDLEGTHATDSQDDRE